MAPIVSGLYFNSYTDPVFLKSSKPVIAVLTLPNDIEYSWRDDSISHIRAVYVKNLESGGMRVIPLLYNSTFDQVDFLLNRVNGNHHLGLFFTGGSANLFYTDDDGDRKFTPYMEMVSYLLKKVMEKNKRHEHFPLFTVCLGLEVLSIALMEGCALDTSDGWNYTTNIVFTDKAPTSRLFSNADPRIMYYLNNYNITAQNHHYAVSLEFYLENPKLNTFLDVIGLSIDKQGVAYLSIIEAQKFPIYGIMFHAEKAAQ